jgi:hypothetical protein
LNKTPTPHFPVLSTDLLEIDLDHFLKTMPDIKIESGDASRACFEPQPFK